MSESKPANNVKEIINPKLSTSDNDAKTARYSQADLDEFCLWLYGIHEEITIKST